MEEQMKTDKELRAEKKAEQSTADKTKNRKKILGQVARIGAAALAIVAVIGGLVFLAERQEKVDQTSPLTNTVTASDHIMGNHEAKVTLIEYADFQCPACGTYAPLMERLYTEYGDRVQFVYRHFPLTSLHPNANEAARAAEAAGQQGKFFEFAHLLFSRQNEWDDERDPFAKFEGYANELGLNKEQFVDGYKSSEAKAKVNADYKSGLEASVSGTPTFFLNGQAITSPRGYDAFKKVLDDELAKTSTNSTDATEAPAENSATETE